MGALMCTYSIEKGGLNMTMARQARHYAGIPTEELRQEATPALFVQPQFSRLTAQRVASSLDCKLVELDPLAGDYLNNLETMALNIEEAWQ